MKITKFGQCCLLIEVAGKRILTDPGRFSNTQNNVTDIDVILITHEHADHLHTESLQVILASSPDAEIVTNTSVGAILTELGVTHTIVEGRELAEKAEITLEAFDGNHAEIFEEYGQVQNTGYFINEELFYPGDAYTEPGKSVPILALPVAGPWCKAADAIAYAHKVAPEKAFPVHDWLLNEDGINLTYGLFGSQLQAKDIEFVELRNGESKEL